MPGRLVAEIDLEAIRHNVRLVREFVGPAVAVMAIVKADGYGHGAIEVSRAALYAGASSLGVATVSEGIALRAALPNTPIYHLPPFPPDSAVNVVHHRLVPLISDLAGLHHLNVAAERQGAVAELHMEIDTGMGRSGASAEEAFRIASRIREFRSVRLTGCATHFAAAESDPVYTRRQIELFHDALEKVGGMHPYGVLHAANSPATLLYPESHFHMVRPGLLTYGILPQLPADYNPPTFRPALTLKTWIALIRELAAGASLSYSRTHTLTRPSRIATLPVGYGDGYPRALSNIGEVLVCGRRAPILGRVCMDVMLVDVTDIPEANACAEVILIGRQGDEQIRVEEIARLVDTTDHDITTRLTSRVERKYV
jgi:alanine racemase